MRPLLLVICLAVVGAFACSDRSSSTPTQTNKTVETTDDTTAEQIDRKAEDTTGNAGDKLDQAGDNLQQAAVNAVEAADHKIADLEARAADVDDQARESYDQEIARLKNMRDQLAQNADDATTTTKASIDRGLDEVETQYNKALEVLKTDD